MTSRISATGAASLSRGPQPVTADPAALSLSLPSALRMNPCPSANPGEGEQEENRQGGPPGPQRPEEAKMGGCGP